MNFRSNHFKAECKDLGNGNFLHMINIEDIDTNLKSFIDKSIVSICEGNTGSDLKIIKQELINYLNPKRNSTLEMGAIAEFFIHLYLNDIGFKQECIFQNLEGGAIKKGFDGYYSLTDEEWLFESKSGKISSKNISHCSKLTEAYKDLKDKLSGAVKNNPWKNAYNHARIVGSDNDILKNIKKLSDDFINNFYHDIKDFNIIPGSTIFLEGNWESINSTELNNAVEKLIRVFQYKKITILCVNKKTIQLFWEYLNAE